MKAFILIIVAACLMAGCKKDSSPFAKYYGKWELRKTSGGGFVLSDSTYKPGNGNIYQINSNSTYKHFAKGALDKQGTYQIKATDNTNDAIYFDGEDNGEPISITGAQMTLGMTVADGIAYNYDKIGN